MLQKLERLSGKFLDAITNKYVTILLLSVLFLTFIIGCVGYAVTHII